MYVWLRFATQAEIHSKLIDSAYNKYPMEDGSIRRRKVWCENIYDFIVSMF